MKRKRLITKCAYPWGEFSPTHAINHYLGCAFNCSYCWSRDVWWKRMGGHLSKVWGVPEEFEWHKPIMFDYVDMLYRELHIKGLPKGSRLLLSSTTDPYQPIEAETKATRHILVRLWAEGGIPVMILTKAALLPERDFDILKSMDAWFGVTMDREFSYSDWHYARMTTLHEAHRRGIKTFVSLEPWIPGVDAEAIVRDMASFVDHWIVGRLNYKGVGDEFYQENLQSLLAFFEGIGVPMWITYYIKPDLMRCLER